jgi:hypothetical protein
MRIYSAGKHKCVCQEMPADFHMADAWLAGGGLWLDHTAKLELCTSILELGK